MNDNVEPTPKSPQTTEYSQKQKRVVYIFYIIIVAAFFITLGGAIYTFADIIAPTGKLDVFLSLGFGFQMTIVAGFLAGLFFMLIFFFALFKRGTSTLLKILFKKRELEEMYKHRIAVKIAAWGLLLSLVVILIGFLIATIQEFILGAAGFLSTLLASLSQGGLILFIGIVIFTLVGFVLFCIYFARNGYYLILKFVGGLEAKPR
jgi:hypothetical protein